jgi:hypothetical protein
MLRELPQGPPAASPQDPSSCQRRVQSQPLGLGLCTTAARVTFLLSTLTLTSEVKVKCQRELYFSNLNKHLFNKFSQLIASKVSFN